MVQLNLKAPAEMYWSAKQENLCKGQRLRNLVVENLSCSLSGVDVLISQAKLHTSMKESF